MGRLRLCLNDHGLMGSDNICYELTSLPPMCFVIQSALSIRLSFDTL